MITNCGTFAKVWGGSGRRKYLYIIYMRGPLFEEREHTIYNRTHDRATFRQSPSFPTSNTALKASDL